MKKCCWLFCLVCMLAAPTVVLAWGVEFSAGAWYQRPRGVISYDKTTNVDDLDLEDDLNYDNKWKPSGRLRIDMPFLIPNLYLMYTPMKWDEKSRKKVDFNFGGTNFRGDVDFDSELKMNHLDAALFYGIPGLRAATADILNIDLGLNLRLLDFKAEIEQDDIGEKASESYLLPIPMIFAATQLKPLNWIAIDLEGRGIGYKENHYVSLIGRLKIFPFGPLFLAGGYRYDSVKIDYQDVDIDAEFRGPFAEVGFDF